MCFYILFPILVSKSNINWWMISGAFTVCVQNPEFLSHPYQSCVQSSSSFTTFLSCLHNKWWKMSKWSEKRQAAGSTIKYYAFPSKWSFRRHRLALSTSFISSCILSLFINLKLVFQGYPFPADFTNAACWPSGWYMEASGISCVHTQTSKFEYSKNGVIIDAIYLTVI